MRHRIPFSKDQKENEIGVYDSNQWREERIEERKIENIIHQSSCFVNISLYVVGSYDGNGDRVDQLGSRYLEADGDLVVRGGVIFLEDSEHLDDGVEKDIDDIYHQGKNERDCDAVVGLLGFGKAVDGSKAGAQ